MAFLFVRKEIFLGFRSFDLTALLPLQILTALLQEATYIVLFGTMNLFVVLLFEYGT